MLRSITSRTSTRSPSRSPSRSLPASSKSLTVEEDATKTASLTSHVREDASIEIMKQNCTNSNSFLGYHKSINEDSVRVSPDCRSAVRHYSFNTGMVVTNRPIEGYCEFMVQVSTAATTAQDCRHISKGGIRIGILLINKGTELSLPSSMEDLDYYWQDMGSSGMGDTYRLHVTSIQGNLTVVHNIRTHNEAEEDTRKTVESSGKDVYIVVDHYGTAMATDIVRAVMYSNGFDDSYPFTSDRPPHVLDHTPNLPHHSNSTSNDNSMFLQLIQDIGNPLIPMVSDSLEIITPTDFEVILMPPLEEEILPFSHSPYGKQPTVEESLTMKENTELKLEVLRLHVALNESQLELSKYKDLYVTEVDSHSKTKNNLQEMEVKVNQLQKLMKGSTLDTMKSV